MCNIKLLIWVLSRYFMQALCAVNFSCKIIFLWELQRGLSSKEHWRFFQRSWVNFPAPTWCLVTVYNHSPMGSAILLCYIDIHILQWHLWKKDCLPCVLWFLYVVSSFSFNLGFCFQFLSLFLLWFNFHVWYLVFMDLFTFCIFYCFCFFICISLLLLMSNFIPLWSDRMQAMI